jgi:hypothetical protein
MLLTYEFSFNNKSTLSSSSPHAVSVLGLHGVHVRAEEETFFLFLFPNDREIPTGFSLCFLKVAPVAKFG